MPYDERAYHAELDRAALEGWNACAHDFRLFYLHFRRAAAGEPIGALRFIPEVAEADGFELADPEPWPLRALERGQIYNRLRRAAGRLPILGAY